MKKASAETRDVDVVGKQAAPPPPPPLLEKRLVGMSVTNWEIAKFWREKRCNEEDHLLAAIKAAARIRARKLTEEDYKFFEESLNNYDDSEAENPTRDITRIDEKELRIGIKDWWTKSKYAYLNQPALGSVAKLKRRTSSYIPNFCNYKPPSPATASFGIF